VTEPWALFEAWLTAKQPAKSTVQRWRAVFLDLQEKFHTREISEDAAREWARGLVTADRTAGTVMRIWLSAAKTVYTFAVEQGLIESNPFKAVKVRRLKAEARSIDRIGLEILMRERRPAYGQDCQKAVGASLVNKDSR
jgi:site-specific recombinase XerD